MNGSRAGVLDAEKDLKTAGAERLASQKINTIFSGNENGINH